jgi:hypothetical protein
MEDQVKPIGIYRDTASDSGAEFAFVEYGEELSAGDTVPRNIYEQDGYEPPFDTLPTREQFESL